MKYRAMLLMVVVAGSCAGCASLSPKDVAEPGEITLEDALKSVGTGLYEMKEAEKDVKTGLVVDSVTVAFDLKASADDSGHLSIDLSKPIAPGSADSSIGAGQESSSSAERSNSITIKFVNVLTLPPETLANQKSPEDLEKVLQLLSSGDLTMFRFREDSSQPAANPGTRKK